MFFLVTSHVHVVVASAAIYILMRELKETSIQCFIIIDALMPLEIVEPSHGISHQPCGPLRIGVKGLPLAHTVGFGDLGWAGVGETSKQCFVKPRKMSCPGNRKSLVISQGRA